MDIQAMMQQMGQGGGGGGGVAADVRHAFRFKLVNLLETNLASLNLDHAVTDANK